MSAHAELRDWLIARTLPYWRDHGLDVEGGGFHEKLDLDRAPVTHDGKRIMVQARQTYSFARVAASGEVSGATEAARAGFAFLSSHGRHPDGGWRHRVTRTGAPDDDTRDLYDQAFVLFAAAWAIRVLGLSEARHLADDTLDWLDRDRAHPAGGYVERVDPAGRVVAGPRQQNPHMHLFEALLALHEAIGDGIYLERAGRLFALARDRFVVDGTLREYFTDALDPAPGEAGGIVEPGHQFEWVWLLHRYAALAGDAAAVDLAGRLYRFALDHGIDPASGGVVDEVTADGRRRRDDRRLWPQTEALKAHAARLEYLGDPQAVRLIETQAAVLRRDHLVGPSGAWREHLHPDGSNFHGFLPASSLYHLTFAVTELDRVLADAT